MKIIYITLTLFFSSRSARIELAIRDVQVTLPQQHNDMLFNCNQTAATHHANLEAAIQQRFLSIQSQLSEHQEQTNEWLNEISEQGRTSQVVLDKIVNAITKPNSNLKTVNEVDSIISTLSQGHCHPSGQSFSNKSQHQLPYRRRSVISVSLTKSWKCQDKCRCSCHTRRRFTTPNSVKNIFGALFMNYIGFPLLEGTCHEKSCQHHTPRFFKITYYFPVWIAARVFSLTIGTSHTDSPTFGLVLRRSIPFSYEPHFFQVAWNGNTEEVVSLIESGQAQPNDLDELQGKTALTVIQINL